MEEKREIEKIRERIQELQDQKVSAEELNNLLLEKDRIERTIFEEERKLAEIEKNFGKKNYNISDFSRTDDIKYEVFKEQKNYQDLSLEIDRIEREIETLRLQGEEEYIGDLPQRKEELESKLETSKERLSNNLNLLIEDTKSRITTVEIQKNTLQGYTSEMLSTEEMEKELARFNELINPLEKELEEYQNAYENLQNNRNVEIKFSNELNESFDVKKAYEENDDLVAEINYIEIQKNTLQGYTPEMLSSEEMKEELAKFDQKIAELNAKIESNKNSISSILDSQIKSLEAEMITLDEEKKYLLYSTPTMSEEEMKEEITKYDKQIEEIKKKVKKLKDMLPTGKGTYAWDKGLTEEQKEELFSQGIVPGKKEYEEKLIEMGIVPESKQIEDLKNSLNSNKRRFDELSRNKDSIEELSKLQRISNSYDNFINRNSEEIINQIIDLPDEQKNEVINELVEKITPSEAEKDNFRIWDKHEKLTIEAKEDLKKAVRDKLINKDKEENKEEPLGLPPHNEELHKEENKEEPLGLPPHGEEDKKDEKMWLKALAGAAGFATGVGLNVVVGAVPVIGTVVTIYAAGRTLYNAAKLANTIITKINKGKEPAIITSIKNKIPDKVKVIAEKIFEKPKNPYAKWFVNGVSIGYLADRVFDIHEKLGSAFSSKQVIDTNDVIIDRGIPNSNPEVNVPTDNAEPVINIPNEHIDTIAPTIEIPTLHPGDTIDLSSITHGYASSYGAGYTSLDTSRGVNAIFDKVNVVDGKEWYHFLQPNGYGYAWIPKEQIDELLAQTANVGRSIH